MGGIKPMAKVVATDRGYYGGILRVAGDTFNAEGKASWFKPVSSEFGGKGDHDGDGLTGPEGAGGDRCCHRIGRVMEAVGEVEDEGHHHHDDHERQRHQ